MSNEDPQATPAIPPIPPAPPAPPAPTPQYGEYAQPTTPPAASGPTPAPQYGYAAPLPEYGYPTAKPGRQRRTWDLVLTIVLLGIGLFGAGFGVLYGIIFIIPGYFTEIMSQQPGYAGFEADPGAAGPILILSHSLLYLATLGVSIFMLVKKFITFWVPLSVGVVAAIIFWVTVISVILSDPDFVSTYGSTSL
jgi:hypothetical protein